MRRRAIVALLCLLAIAMSGAGIRQWTDKQKALHEAADLLRAAGYAEESVEIQILQRAWAAEEPHMVVADKMEEEPELSEKLSEKLSKLSETAPETVSKLSEDPAEPEENTDLPEEEILPVWEQFNRKHPGATCTEAGFWSLCKMLVTELGDAQRGGQYDIGTAVIIARGAVNRAVYGDEFPDDIYGVIAQPRQYSTAYLTSYNEGFPAGVIAAAEYALLMDDTLQADYSPTGLDLTIPHSHFYHGNYLTGGYEWLRVNVCTSGGYRATLVFGRDDGHCVEATE